MFSNPPLEISYLLPDKAKFLTGLLISQHLHPAVRTNKRAGSRSRTTVTAIRTYHKTRARAGPLLYSIGAARKSRKGAVVESGRVDRASDLPVVRVRPDKRAPFKYKRHAHIPSPPVGYDIQKDPV